MKTWKEYLVVESTQNYAYFLKKLKDYYNGERMPAACVKTVVDWIKDNKSKTNFIIRFEGRATNDVSHVLVTDSNDKIVADSNQDNKNLKTSIKQGEYVVAGVYGREEAMFNLKSIKVGDFLKMVD
jgi:hypothetical protein